MNREDLILTSLELEVKALLDQVGIVYVAQLPTRTGFVLDFAIPDRHIAIEVDGPHHDTPGQKKRDAFRTHRLKQEGWRVVRLHWREDVVAVQDIIRALNVS